MKIGDLHLRQRDSTTCGPSVAVVAGALVDPAYRKELTGSKIGSTTSNCACTPR